MAPEEPDYEQYCEITLAMAQSTIQQAINTTLRETSPSWEKIVRILLKGDAELSMKMFGFVLAKYGYEVRFSLVPIPKE